MPALKSDTAGEFSMGSGAPFCQFCRRAASFERVFVSELLCRATSSFCGSLVGEFFCCFRVCLNFFAGLVKGALAFRVSANDWYS